MLLSAAAARGDEVEGAVVKGACRAESHIEEELSARLSAADIMAEDSVHVAVPPKLSSAHSVIYTVARGRRGVGPPPGTPRASL